jgi:sigma-B regulation protein RsbU (phosphoserine phosphatase)
LRILIADDDEISLLALQTMLAKRGHTVVTATDGSAAWQRLQEDNPPSLAILDWMMPGLDGVELCRRVRATPSLRSMYIILLTSRDGKDHLIEGLRAGANDYVTKPFDREELEARVNVGTQVVHLQDELRCRVSELELALVNVKQLQGLLPICCYCKKIRDDGNYWQQVESYIVRHSDAQFTHGICPECMDSVVRPQLAKAKDQRETTNHCAGAALQPLDTAAGTMATIPIEPPAKMAVGSGAAES